MDAVLHWLLDSDPAIRWQVLRDLTDAPADRVAAARARVAREGWGAQLLALQGDDGQWAGGACFPAGNFETDEGSGDGSPATDPGEQVWTESPEADDDAEQPWTATLPTMEVLAALGIDPADPVVRGAVDAVARGCRWEHAGQPFFDGEVEACINGRTVALGAYFGEPVERIVGRLVDEQLADGGWNCWALYGATRSSFHSTICVLEGLLAHERATGDPTVREARRRGEEYLLQRRLLHRATTGEVIKPRWLDFSFPTYWHYDLLRGLAYFRDVGGEPDPRLDEAVAILRARRQPDGTWLLDHVHEGATHLSIDAPVGQPSRWNTLRALCVLRWVDGS